MTAGRKPSAFVQEKDLRKYRDGEKWAEDKINSLINAECGDLPRLRAVMNGTKFPAFHRMIKFARLDPPAFATAHDLMLAASKKRSSTRGNDWRGRADRAFWLGVYDWCKNFSEESVSKLDAYREAVTIQLMEEWSKVNGIDIT